MLAQGGAGAPTVDPGWPPWLAVLAITVPVLGLLGQAWFAYRARRVDPEEERLAAEVAERAELRESMVDDLLRRAAMVSEARDQAVEAAENARNAQVAAEYARGKVEQERDECRRELAEVRKELAQMRRDLRRGDDT